MWQKMASLFTSTIKSIFTEKMSKISQFLEAEKIITLEDAIDCLLNRREVLEPDRIIYGRIKIVFDEAVDNGLGEKLRFANSTSNYCTFGTNNFVMTFNEAGFIADIVADNSYSSETVTVAWFYSHQLDGVKFKINGIAYNMLVTAGDYANYLYRELILVATAECGIYIPHKIEYDLTHGNSDNIIGDITFYCNENHEPITPYKTPLYETTSNII